MRFSAAAASASASVLGRRFRVGSRRIGVSSLSTDGKFGCGPANRTQSDRAPLGRSGSVANGVSFGSGVVVSTSFVVEVFGLDGEKFSVASVVGSSSAIGSCVSSLPSDEAPGSTDSTLSSTTAVVDSANVDTVVVFSRRRRLGQSPAADAEGTGRGGAQCTPDPEILRRVSIATGSPPTT